ncbi:DNA primase [Candidatus Azambacteria bacterium]|nr:DNA primase [Candidatus Azambacteria bacterium]
MADQVQEIKEKLNIVDVLSSYIRLQKAGVNFRALCPFHNEKTPSFMVSPSRQSWHCFGCAEGGDMFTFIQKIEGMEFPEVLKLLAEKAGVVLKYENPKLRSEKDRAYEICEKAAQFFTLALRNFNLRAHSSGANENPILNYLRKRGLEDATVDEWRLGYAPDSWDSLLSFLRKYGYRETEMERAGLVLRGAQYHDRFRNRLMFPIFDSNGRVVAFSGRIMSEIIPSKTEKADSGKYINSPETVLFSKSRVLYGLDKAKSEIRKADRAILVEGQMDVLLPWQDGVRNVVAASGTALTENHLLVLKRLTGNLTLAFDMDDAGAKATERGDLAAVRAGFNVSVVNLPSGKDPADFVMDKPGEFVKLAAAAEPIMNYYFKQVFSARGGSGDGEGEIPFENRKFIAVDLLMKIKRLPSALEKSHWIRELSLRLGVSENDLKEEMERLTLPDDAGSETPAGAPAIGMATAKTRKEILSERLLALLLKKPEFTALAVKIAAFLPQKDYEILGMIAAKQNNFSDIRSALAAGLRPRIDFLYLAGDYELGKADADFDIGKEVEILTVGIKREHYKEALQKINWEIQREEMAGNSDLSKLTEEFKEISNKLHVLSKNKIGGD